MLALDALQMAGTAHDRADVATRERLAPALGALAAAARAAGLPHLVLATCNRHELYWLGPLALDDLAVALAEGTAVHRGGEAAVAHLLAVAGGRASLVLGEAEVLGQVRRAWHAAREAGTSSEALDRLLRRVIAGARRVRRAAAFDDRAAVAVLGVEAALARSPAAVPRVVIIGAGEAAIGAATALRGAVADARLTVVARRLDRAARVAAAAGGSARGWAALADAVGEADVVITATGARLPVLGASELRRRRPGLVLLDLGVPRNVDPMVRAFAGLTVLDLDDLAAARGAPSDAARAAADRADAAIAAELRRLRRATTEHDLPDLLSDLHARGDDIAAAQAAALVAELGLEDQAMHAAVARAMRQAVRRALFPASRVLRGEVVAAG